jgi:hypothetical protein
MSNVLAPFVTLCVTATLIFYVGARATNSAASTKIVDALCRLVIRLVIICAIIAGSIGNSATNITTIYQIFDHFLAATVRRLIVPRYNGAPSHPGDPKHDNDPSHPVGPALPHPTAGASGRSDDRVALHL